MTSTATPGPGPMWSAARADTDFRGLEVATVAADALRASVQVSGVLQASTVALLTSVLRTHMSAGRRYLRVDLAGAGVADAEVGDAMFASHQAVCDLGGMLVFENASPSVLAVIGGDRLYLRPAQD